MIIGICGGTGSGKTTIARSIVDAVGRENVVLVEQDSYYRNLADMPLDERHQANFDHPDSIDSDMLVEKLNAYESFFVTRFRALMRAKVGFARTEDGDDELIRSLLQLMAKTRADYSLTFRGLTATDEDWLFLFGLARDEALQWRERYRARMDGEGDRRAAMDAVNPKYVLRNWVAETAIRAVEDRGDSAPLDRILRLVQSPYAEHAGEDALAQPPAPEFSGLSVSCSS